VRIISATNRDLSDAVKGGTFREDLFYRLNVFPILVPRLRDRREDIPALLDHFIKRFNAQERLSVMGTTTSTIEMLKTYDWPGNVRQLENTIYRAMILSDGVMLKPHDFPQISGLSPAMQTQSPDPINSLIGTAEPASETQGAIEFMDRDGHLRSLEEIERDLIEFAIDTYSGHMSEVARRLGIGRSTLYRKVREHDLDVDTKKSA